MGPYSRKDTVVQLTAVQTDLTFLHRFLLPHVLYLTCGSGKQAAGSGCAGGGRRSGLAAAGSSGSGVWARAGAALPGRVPARHARPTRTRCAGAHCEHCRCCQMEVLRHRLGRRLARG